MRFNKVIIILLSLYLSTFVSAFGDDYLSLRKFYTDYYGEFNIQYTGMNNQATRLYTSSDTTNKNVFVVFDITQEDKVMPPLYLSIDFGGKLKGLDNSNKILVKNSKGISFYLLNPDDTVQYQGTYKGYQSYFDARYAVFNANDSVCYTGHNDTSHLDFKLAVVDANREGDYSDTIQTITMSSTICENSIYLCKDSSKLAVRTGGKWGNENYDTHFYSINSIDGSLIETGKFLAPLNSGWGGAVTYSKPYLSNNGNWCYLTLRQKNKLYIIDATRTGVFGDAVEYTPQVTDIFQTEAGKNLTKIAIYGRYAEPQRDCIFIMNINPVTGLVESEGKFVDDIYKPNDIIGFSPDESKIYCGGYKDGYYLLTIDATRTGTFSDVLQAIYVPFIPDVSYRIINEKAIIYASGGYIKGDYYIFDINPDTGLLEQRFIFYYPGYNEYDGEAYLSNNGSFAYLKNKTGSALLLDILNTPEPHPNYTVMSLGSFKEVVVNNDETILYSSGDQLYMYDINQNDKILTQRGRFMLGGNGFILSPDGKFLWVRDSAKNKIYTIDAQKTSDFSNYYYSMSCNPATYKYFTIAPPGDKMGIITNYYDGSTGRTYVSESVIFQNIDTSTGRFISGKSHLLYQGWGAPIGYGPVLFDNTGNVAFIFANYLGPSNFQIFKNFDYYKTVNTYYSAGITSLFMDDTENILCVFDGLYYIDIYDVDTQSGDVTLKGVFKTSWGIQCFGNFNNGFCYSVTKNNHTIGVFDLYNIWIDCPPIAYYDVGREIKAIRLSEDKQTLMVVCTDTIFIYDILPRQYAYADVWQIYD